MKTKRFKKVVEVDEIVLKMTKFTWSVFGIIWLIFIIAISFTPDSHFSKGRIAAIFFMTLLTSGMPIISSFFLWLGREVYLEEVK